MCKNNKKGKHLLARGFSTVELLVVMSLMLVVITSSVGIFLLVSRTQKRIIASQQIQGKVRYAFELVTRDIHTSTIDYDYYKDNNIQLLGNDNEVLPIDILALRDNFNQPVKYRLSGYKLQTSRGYTSGSETWYDLLSDNVKVVNLGFYIVPATNPFAPCTTLECGEVPNQQPRITISIVATNSVASIDAGYPQVIMRLQSTILSRVYFR